MFTFCGVRYHSVDSANNRIIIYKLFILLMMCWPRRCCCFYTGALSIYNTSHYSNEKAFNTLPVSAPSATERTAGSKSQNITVVAVAIVVSLFLLVIIGGVFYCLMRRKKKQKENSNTQHVPGLEDLIEMRTRAHSAGAESRGNRDLFELGRERPLSVFNAKTVIICKQFCCVL